VKSRLPISLALLVTLSACSWWHHKPPPPPPTEVVVNGAPVDSVVFVDGTQVGQPVPRGKNAQIFAVSPGDHKVEVHVGDRVVYHEDVYAASGQRYMISVLSGWNP
jgi:hypothetical protein